MIIVSIIIGCIIGLNFPIIFPQNSTEYLGVIFVISLDLFSKYILYDINKENKNKFILLEFITNIIISFLLICIGSIISQSLYIVVCAVFAMKIFNNFSKIIEILLQKY